MSHSFVVARSWAISPRPSHRHQVLFIRVPSPSTSYIHHLIPQQHVSCLMMCVVTGNTGTSTCMAVAAPAFKPQVLLPWQQLPKDKWFVRPPTEKREKTVNNTSWVFLQRNQILLGLGLSTRQMLRNETGFHARHLNGEIHKYRVWSQASCVMQCGAVPYKEYRYDSVDLISFTRLPLCIYIAPGISALDQSPAELMWVG